MTSRLQFTFVCFVALIGLVQSVVPLLVGVAGGALAGSWLVYDQFRLNFNPLINFLIFACYLC